MDKETNKKFSENNEEFKKACAEAGLPNHVNVIHKIESKTTSAGITSLARQASKFRNKKGLAYKKLKGLL